MKLFVVVVFCLQILACSSTPGELNRYPDSLRSCVDTLIDFKQIVTQHQVNDAQLLWSEAYPHLAFDRFSLSLVNQLNNAHARQQWLSYVTSQAQAQRRIEYQNLADKSTADLTTLNSCSAQLTRANINDQHFWQQLQQSAPVYPSDYQTWQRVLGLYPLTKLIVAPAITVEQYRIRQGFEQPAAGNALAYSSPDRSKLLPQQIQRWFKEANAASTLSWPLLPEQKIASLLNFYSPNWLIETVSDDDRPGKLAYSASNAARVDPQQPVVYVFPSYTRFHGQILLQLNYNLWFANRTATSSFDPYGGKFDAVILRLTLDKNGQPYILDTIHSCGCYHMVLSLSQELNYAPQNSDIEQPLVLQRPQNAAGATRLTATLTSGAHMVKGIAWPEVSDENPIQQYSEQQGADWQSSFDNISLTEVPYHQLRSLRFRPDRNKSLFDPQGMLLKSRRGERWFLWPFGVKSPGAMRQIGHHAIVFVGERHFDDPYMLESLFNPN